jgi:2-oxoglutarate dehydrogenase complex dehydrogenase (E1) component-like enzyme
VQEEPRNMGAYAHARRNMIERLPVGMLDIGYIGRSYRSSPSEGYGAAHAIEQERIVKQALAE